jgi:hypothetical protein
MMDEKVKAILLLGLSMVIIGFIMWSELSFQIIGFGVIITGIALTMHINKKK